MANFRFRIAALAAGATNANAIAGSAFEFVGRPSRVQVWAVQEAGVGAAGDVTCQVQYGPEIQLETAPVPQEVAAGRGPITDDPPLSDDIAAPGDRLVIRVTNTGGAAPDVIGIVRIVPVA